MVRKLVTAAILTGAVVLSCGLARADSIYGSCRYKDGSKAGSEISISTSWNGKKAYPANGRYTLDFGEKVRKRVTVYVKGSSVGSVYVEGLTSFDIVVP